MKSVKKEIQVSEELAWEMEDIVNQETAVDRALQSALYAAEQRLSTLARKKKEWWDRATAPAGSDRRWTYDKDRRVLYKDHERVDVKIKTIKQ